MFPPSYEDRRQSMAVNNTDRIERFQAERDKFCELRKRFERPSVCGRSFVLADRVTEALNENEKSGSCGVYNLMWTAHSTRSLKPPGLREEELKPMCHILYILLDLELPHLIHLFHELNNNDLPIDKAFLEQKVRRDELRGEDLNGEGPDAFYDRFCQAQLDWCPLVFNWRMHAVVEKQIVPYYRKETILPNQSANVNVPGIHRAKLYEIHVPKELVRDQLREKLNTADLLRRQAETSTGQGLPVVQEPQYFRFALKEFSEDMKADFDRERQAFDALGGQSGMIQYYGWYESRSETQHTYNIVLEYADFDLHNAIQKESPPISPSEIKGFWEQMLGLAKTLDSIHQLDVEGHKYDFWHGDIKPENILRVRDRFKLADPGDGRVRLASEGNDQPRARVYGGTRTYASPEKANVLDGGHGPGDRSILQNSDVWSLACVFSVAATYVVLGAQGVVIYDWIRKDAHSQTPNDLIRDDFHDGKAVLPVVKDWHAYLRSSIRHTDAYTDSILTIIDEHLFIISEERWDAAKLSECLADLIETPPIQALPVPKSIEATLQRIDLEVELTLESSAHINRVDSDMAKQQIQVTQQRRGDLKAKDQSKSGAELFNNTQILPTSQRSEHREALLESLSQSESREGGLPPGFTHMPRHSSSSSGWLPKLSPVPSDVQLVGENVSAVTTGPLAKVQGEELPVTMWMVEDELKSLGKGRSLRNLKDIRATKSLNQPVSVKGKMPNDPLKDAYAERDIVYLVDNGASMARYWSEASHLLRVLVWRSLGYDDDGMELYFTDPDTKRSVTPSGSQTVAQFDDAMKFARPPGSSRRRTNIWPKLQEIINKYITSRESSAKERRKTIIILTDGVWDGMAHESHLEQSIVHNFTHLTHLHQDDKVPRSPDQAGPHEETPQQILERIRPITIQFIAFGHDKQGLRRMKRLDDDPLEPGWPDLIDMEPSSGDVYKMFLGSLNPKWDSKVNRVNSTIPVTPISPPLSTSTTGVSSSQDDRYTQPSSPAVNSAWPSSNRPGHPHEPRFSWSSAPSPSHSRVASADIGPIEQVPSPQSEQTLPP